MLAEHDVRPEPRQLEAHSAALAITRTSNCILRHAMLPTILHPGNGMPVRVRHPHFRPSREDDRQVVRQFPALLVTVNNIEGFGEREKLCPWIVLGDLAHPVQVVDAENIAGNMPAKVSWSVVRDDPGDL